MQNFFLIQDSAIYGLIKDEINLKFQQPYPERGTKIDSTKLTVILYFHFPWALTECEQFVPTVLYSSYYFGANASLAQSEKSDRHNILVLC